MAAKTSLRQKAETFIVVTLITMLVWLYAEGRNVTEYANEPIEVRFVPHDDPGLTITPDQPQRVLIDFEGSTAMKQALDAMVGPIELPVAKTDDSLLPFPVYLRDRLNESWLDDLGIQITRTDPELILVTARRYVTVSMPVEVKVEGVELVIPPTVEPEQVGVKMPDTLGRAAQDLSLRVDLDPSQLAGIQAGVPRTVSGRIELPDELEGQGAELATHNASVSLVIREQTESTTLATVPIHINAPPTALDRFRITLPEDQLVLRDVKLSGPGDEIQAINDKRFKVWAEIRPSADELDAAVASSKPQATLHLHIPFGVSVDSPIPRITIEVKRLK